MLAVCIHTYIPKKLITPASGTLFQCKYAETFWIVQKIQMLDKLHSACESGALEDVKALLQDGADIMAVNDVSNGMHICKHVFYHMRPMIWPDHKCMGAQDGRSCLLEASRKGHIEVVKYLCELGGEKLLMLTNEVIMALLHLHICCQKYILPWCFPGTFPGPGIA
jgi:hypothetical protein